MLAFALLHSDSKAKFACYLRCFFTSYFCIPVPYNEKDIFFRLGAQRPLLYFWLQNSMQENSLQQPDFLHQSVTEQ